MCTYAFFPPLFLNLTPFFLPSPPMISFYKVRKVNKTYGSLDFGIKVPSSLIRSLMLNRRLLSTTKQKQERERERKKKSMTSV